MENENIISEENNQFQQENPKVPRKCVLRPSIVLNVVIFVAIAVLYFLHFYKPSAPQSANLSNNGVEAKIAFFNTDTVFQNYDLVDELGEDLKKEKEKLEGSFNAKQASFEQKVKNYQNNVKNNTINATQAQNAENLLMKEREEIMKMNEEFTQQLMVKEAEINKKITEDIIAYANKFNTKYGADYILGYTKGGPIIVVNEKMDVTKEIIEGLNKEHKEKKGKQ